MVQQDQPVRVEAIDWLASLPFLRLFSTFRMAIHPPKLLMALLLVIVLYLFGCVLDLCFGKQVYRDEISQYAVMSSDTFETWRQQHQADFPKEISLVISRLPISNDQTLKANIRASRTTEAEKIASVKQAVNKYYDSKREQLIKKDISDAEQRSGLERLEQRRRELLDEIGGLERQGIFAAMLAFKMDTFGQLVHAASSFNFGFQDLVNDRPNSAGTVCAALRNLLATLPCWLYHNHFWFLLFWFFPGMAIWTLLGGAMCRMTAVDATRRQRIPATQAIAYAGSKWISFYVSPLIPLTLIALLWLAMAIGGLLLKLPVLEVIGAILFFLALAGSLIVALILIGLVGASNLLYPAIAVEGTDAFDAISRAYSYVYKRPWHLIFYSLVSLVYGAVTYLFVGVAIYMCLAVTHHFVGTWVGQAHFQALMPLPQLGNLSYDVDWSRLGASGTIAAALIKLWASLLIAILGAYAVSYYFSANTWIYLLLRHAVDDTGFDDVHLDSETDSQPHAVDKIEPVSPAQD